MVKKKFVDSACPICSGEGDFYCMVFLGHHSFMKFKICGDCVKNYKILIKNNRRYRLNEEEEIEFKETFDKQIEKYNGGNK